MAVQTHRWRPVGQRELFPLLCIASHWGQGGDAQPAHQSCSSCAWPEESLPLPFSSGRASSTPRPQCPWVDGAGLVFHTSPPSLQA